MLCVYCVPRKTKNGNFMNIQIIIFNQNVDKNPIEKCINMALGHRLGDVELSFILQKTHDEITLLDRATLIDKIFANDADAICVCHPTDGLLVTTGEIFDVTPSVPVVMVEINNTSNIDDMGIANITKTMQEIFNLSEAVYVSSGGSEVVEYSPAS